MSEKLTNVELEELETFVRNYEDPNSNAWGSFRGNATEWERMVSLLRRVLNELLDLRARNVAK